MNISTYLRILSYLFVFIGAFIGIDTINKKEYTEGLRQAMSIGIIPLSLLSAIRHIILRGSIIKNQEFFEFEAGGANLAIAIASILAVANKMDNEAMGIIFLIYAAYLFMGSLAWIIYNRKKPSIIWTIMSFWSIVGLLIYYSYIGFSKEDTSVK